MHDDDPAAADRSDSNATARKAGAPGPIDAVVPGWLSLPPLRYPKTYLTLVIVSAFDIILTWVILKVFGGEEINPLAREVIASWSLPGAIAFKFGLVVIAIILFESIGRIKDKTGRWMARIGVAISAAPVVWSIGLLISHRVA